MGPGMKGLSKLYILRAAEDSLRRLQTEYIDLYQTHRDDPGTPVEGDSGGVRSPCEGGEGQGYRGVET